MAPAAKKEAPAPKVQEVTGPITILEHVEIKEGEFVAYMDKYLARIDDKQRQSFADSRDTLKNLRKGYEQHVLKFTNKKDGVDGMLCVDIDPFR